MAGGEEVGGGIDGDAGAVGEVEGEGGGGGGGGGGADGGAAGVAVARRVRLELASKP